VGIRDPVRDERERDRRLQEPDVARPEREDRRDVHQQEHEPRRGERLVDSERPHRGPHRQQLERPADELHQHREAGGGAAGGLGAALASLGAELVPGAALVLDELGFDPSGYRLVVTGEGTVDATTARGKAPAEVARRCAAAGVRCVVFGGRIVEPLAGTETVALSGDPARAREDLVELGARLGGLDLMQPLGERL
jgi:hypothetical protein